MARASSAAVQAATNAVTALATHVSLASGDPSTTGANEITVGSSRQAVTWGAANSSGTAVNTNAPAVPIPASTTASHFGTWNGAAGAYTIGGVLTSSINTGATAGTVTFAAGSLSTTTA
jgi:hypothetical protein